MTQTNTNFICFLAKYFDNLYWGYLLQKPLMVLPRTLIFWLSKIRVFQCRKIFFYQINRNNVWRVVFYIVQILKFRQKFRSKVPGTIIWKILVDETKRVFCFIFDHFFLKIAPYVFWWSFRRVDFYSFCQLIQKCFNDP